MKTITGLNANTPQNLLLDSGAFFKDYDPSTDTPATATTKLLGATSGGGSFNAVPSIRAIEVDGARGYVRDLTVIDTWEVTMVANVKEFTKNAIMLALGACEEKNGAIVGKPDFSESDYPTNITWVGRVKGKEDPCCIQILNPISQNGLNLTFEDKNEAVIPITLTGTYSISDLDTPPFKIILPTK